MQKSQGCGTQIVQPINLLATRQTGGAGIVRDASYDNRFFSTMAVLILATTAIGFSRTYYLNGLMRAPFPSGVIHLHAVEFGMLEMRSRGRGTLEIPDQRTWTIPASLAAVAELSITMHIVR